MTARGEEEIDLGGVLCESLTRRHDDGVIRGKPPTM